MVKNHPYQNVYFNFLAGKNIEKKFNGEKVVTFIRKFEKFYPAENYHQDYYQEYFLNYLRYKKACRREKILNNIWGS